MSNNSNSGSSRTAQSGRPSVSKQRYVIEVKHDRNNSLLFGPLSATLRGRWEFHRVARFPINENSGLTALMETAPVIPGMYIWVDLEKNQGGAYDPLRETEQGRRLMTKIQSHYKTVDNRVVEPADPIEVNGMDADLLKDFLYWMVRAVEDGNAQVVGGAPELPSLEDVKKMPGKRTLNHGYTSNDETTRSFERKYEFEVPN